MEKNYIIKTITSILTYFYLVIIAFGIIGNILSFVIFSRKKFQHTIFSTYFRFLSIFDTLAVLFGLVDYVSFHSEISVKEMSLFNCKIIEYFSYITPSVSAWILVVISMDRLISIVRPSLFQIRKKNSFQISVCIFLLFFNLIYYIQLLFSIIIPYEINEATNETRLWCSVISNEYGPIFDWLDLFYSTIFPFILMFISTVFSLIFIYISRKNTNHLNNLSKDIKFGITSFCLNFLFLLLNFPLQCFYILWNSIKDNVGYYDEIIDWAFSLLFYSNYGILFYISIITNSLFRKELKMIFIKFKKSRFLNYFS